MSELRKKFKRFFLAHGLKIVSEYYADKCEQIADDYALKFREWLTDVHFVNTQYEYMDTEQLLQYFKDNIYGKE